MILQPVFPSLAKRACLPVGRARGDFATANPWTVVLVSVVMFLGAMFLALQLQFSHNSLNYLKKDVPIRMDTELTDKEMKGSFNIEVMIDTGKEHGLYDPSALKKIEQVQQMTKGIAVGDRSVGRAMLFTTIILTAGFLILLLAELKSTINFGIITGFTISMALLADFLLAPAMMVLLTRKNKT